MKTTPFVVLAALACAAQAQPAGFDLQAHRGARALWPENSLVGFRHAVALGVTTLELDIAITRDRVLVVSHDSTLNPDITRGPDGRFLQGRGPAIVDLTADALGAYDVGRIRPGTAYARQFPDQQPVDGTRIPRLSELVEAVRAMGDTQVRFAIETKLNPERPGETVDAEEFARLVVAAIRAHGLAERASVLSFDWRTLQAVQRDAPDIATVYLTVQNPDYSSVREGSPWTAGLSLRAHGSVPRTVKAAGGRAWSANHEALTPALVQEAQALGLQVLAWTVNDTGRMEQLIDMGVDGIVTDRPDLLREVALRRGKRVAAPPQPR